MKALDAIVGSVDGAFSHFNRQLHAAWCDADGGACVWALHNLCCFICSTSRVLIVLPLQSIPGSAGGA